MMHQRPAEMALEDILQYLDPPESLHSLVDVKPVPNVFTRLWYDVLFGTSDSVYPTVYEPPRLMLGRSALRFCTIAAAIAGVFVVTFKLLSIVPYYPHYALPSVAPNTGGSDDSFPLVRLRGQVKDAKTKKPVRDAEVIILVDGHPLGFVRTDSRGMFEYDNVDEFLMRKRNAEMLKERNKAVEEFYNRRSESAEPSPTPRQTITLVTVGVEAPGYRFYRSELDPLNSPRSDFFQIDLVPVTQTPR